MSDPERLRLASLLRAAREESGLSQEQVAEKLGIPRPAVSQIEAGNRRVEALELTRFARAYGQPLSYFAGEAVEGDGADALFRATQGLSSADRDKVREYAELLKLQSGKKDPRK